MKVNLDADPKDLGAALTVAFQVQSQNPQMKVGQKVKIDKFTVTKNTGSWLVKASSK